MHGIVIFFRRSVVSVSENTFTSHGKQAGHHGLKGISRGAYSIFSSPESTPVAMHLIVTTYHMVFISEEPNPVSH